MRTRRPFSTISYNSDMFLVQKLLQWQHDRKISFWVFINHVPDEDVGKNHKHLYIVPDVTIDTVDFLFDLEEIDLDNALPLKCMPCRHSKWDDWALYSVHDKYYLKYKGKERHVFYQWEDFISSDDDFFNYMVHEIDQTPYRGYEGIRQAYYSGESFADLIDRGLIPLNRISQFSLVWKSLSEGRMNAKDHGNMDPISGEILDIENYKLVKEGKL